MHALDMEALLTLCHLSVLLVALPRGPLLLDARVPLDIAHAISCNEVMLLMLICIPYLCHIHILYLEQYLYLLLHA